MANVLIIGAGGHGMVVADILLQMRKKDSSVNIVGFLDDDRALHGSKILGYEVRGAVGDVKKVEHDRVIVAVGNNKTRKTVADSLVRMEERFFSAIHPSAVIGHEVTLGQGIMVCGNVVVNPESTVGDHVILNTGCTVDHHNRIEDYVHIAPGVHLGGDVTVRDGALVGIGCSVIPSVHIGKWSVTGAGSVVTGNVADGALVCGVPARLIKEKV